MLKRIWMSLLALFGYSVKTQANLMNLAYAYDQNFKSYSPEIEIELEGLAIELYEIVEQIEFASTAEQKEMAKRSLAIIHILRSYGYPLDSGFILAANGSSFICFKKTKK